MKTILTITIFVSGLTAQTTVSPVRGTGEIAHAYDVAKNYGASGSATTTTGTIAAGSSSLTVASASTFSPGQGIFVAGAGSTSGSNPAGNLIATISTISGTTVTLAANATVSVTSALVQHDDTASINAAIAAAYNAGGGLVWFPTTGVDGIYRCSGLANATTGGILTFPQNLTYPGSQPTVSFLGEIEGYASSGAPVAGGVTLDFSHAPNVAGNAAIAPAAFVKAGSGNFTTVFEAVNVIVDNIAVLLPASNAMNGLMFSNVMQAQIGDHVSVATKDCCAAQPTSGTNGIWMPQAYNNVLNNIGNAIVVGFDHCLTPGDHARLGKPYLAACNVPVWINGGFDVIVGSVTIESSPVMIEMNASTPANGNQPLDLTIDAESYGTGWAARGSYDVIDAGQALTGIIRYKLYAGGGYPALNINGAGNVNFQNLEQEPAYISGVSGCGALGAVSVSQFSSQIVGKITGAPTGSCPAVLTFTQSFANGWSCWINNQTHPGATNLVGQASSTGTTATFQGTTISGDVLNFGCTPIAGHP